MKSQTHKHMVKPWNDPHPSPTLVVASTEPKNQTQTRKRNPESPLAI